MKRSAKNYICIFITLAALYFAGVSIIKAHELQAYSEESGEPVSESVSSWYLAASLEGMIGAAGLTWFFLSKENKKTVKETLTGVQSKAILTGGAVAGLALGYAASSGMMGSLGKMDLPSMQVATEVSEVEEEPEETEQTPEKEVPVTADTFPVASDQDDSDSDSDSAPVKGSGILTISDAQDLADYYPSTESDKSSILISDGGSAVLMGLVEKSGDAKNPDQAISQGANAAVYVEKGGVLDLRGGSVNTSAAGAPALSVQGGTASVADSTLTTTKKDSEILFAAAGGSITGSNIQVSTAGELSPVLVTGNQGTIQLDSCVLNTTGFNSPVVQGSGSFVLSNCGASLGSGSGAILYGGSSLKYDYSSMSASGQGGMFLICKDPQETEKDQASISLTGTKVDVSSSDAQSAPLFKVDHADGSAYLNGNIITLASGRLAQIAQGSLELSLDAQTLEGKIILDKESTAKVELKNGAVLSTSINADNSGGVVDLYLDSTSTLSLTGDCHVSSLSNDFGSNDNIKFNGFTIYVDGEPVTY